MAGRLRNIVREPEFEEQLVRLLVNLEEADEFTLRAEMLLASDPLAGSPSRDPDVWMLPMAPVRGREVWLYYAFDESRVVFLALLAFD